MRRVFNYDRFWEFVDSHNVSTVFRNGIVACGILFYKIIDGQVCVLLSKKEGKDELEDIGGKIECRDSDNSVLGAAIREMWEETNRVIGRDEVWHYIRKFHNYQKKEFQKHYNQQGMYYCYLIEVDSGFVADAHETMGDVETHTGIKRTIRWYYLEDVRHRLANRVRGVQVR